MSDAAAAWRDGLTWHPRVTIEKYSRDQVDYARRCGESVKPAYMHLQRHVLTGDLMRLLFREPEDGTVHDEGNGVTAWGMENLARVLTGEAGHPLKPGRAGFGVGSDPAGFDREHAHLSNALSEGPGRSWYRPMDAGYPVVQAGTAAIEGACTFAESEACFAWHEWCWASGPVRPSAHHELAGAYGGGAPVMINRKGHPAGYGVKEPGVAWCFRTVIELRG